jgi:hypothetical protein
MQIDNIKSFLEGTVAADIAQSTGSMGLKKQKRHGAGKDCPCDKDPESEECQKQLQESPVGSVGSTGLKDAESHLSDPEIRKQLKKLIRQAGGKTVILQMLKTMNQMPANESKITEASRQEERAVEAILMALDECSNDVNVLGTFSDRGVMTRDAGFEMKYKGKEFQVTVVQV